VAPATRLSLARKTCCSTWGSYVGSRARYALRFLLEDGAWEAVSVDVQAQRQAELQESTERHVVTLELSADGERLSDTHISIHERRHSQADELVGLHRPVEPLGLVEVRLREGRCAVREAWDDRPSSISSRGGRTYSWT